MPRRKKQENIESAEKKESESELVEIIEGKSKPTESKNAEPKSTDKREHELKDSEAQVQGDSINGVVSSVVVPNPLTELKAKIESILYCIPSGVTVELLAHKISMASTESVQWALEELKKDFDVKAGSLKVVFEGSVWKFKVPDEHSQLIQQAAAPEFDTAVVETLAYIAWRNGSRQCDVVRVRGNKAYNHIKLLKEKEFIESHKSGLSKWLEPTKKFYEYFNLKQGEKLPVPEEVVRAADEAEKAAAAAKLQESEQVAQQEHVIAALKKKPESSKSDSNEPESEPEPEPSGDEPDSDEPDEGSEEEPEEGDEEENKLNKDNPDNE